MKFCLWRSKHLFQSLQIILAGEDTLSFPWANGVTSRIIFMLNWEPGHEAAAGSAVRFTIGRPGTSDLDQCASCLVPGGMGMPPGACSLGRGGCLDKYSISTVRSADSESVTRCACGYGFPSDPWEGSCLATQCVPWNSEWDLCVRGTETKSQGCFRIHSLYWGLQTCLWGHRWCVSKRSWLGRTALLLSVQS